MPEELWTEICNIAQEAVIKTIPKKNKLKKAHWLSEEVLQIAEERREAKGKGEKEKYTHLNAEFQRIERRDKKAFLGDQCKEVSSVQSVSRVRLIETPGTAARQVSLSITNSRSLLKLMSIRLVIPSNHLILCHPLLLLPSILPRIRVFSNESFLCIRWSKYWSFSFSISPSNDFLWD